MGNLRAARRLQGKLGNGTKNPKTTNNDRRTMGTIERTPITTLPRKIKRPTLRQTIRKPSFFRAGKVLSAVAFLSAFGINVVKANEINTQNEIYRNVRAVSESLTVQGLKAEPFFKNGEEQVILRKIPKKEQLDAIKYKLIMGSFRGINLRLYGEVFGKLNAFLEKNPKFLLENADKPIADLAKKIFGFYEPNELSTLTLREVFEISEDPRIKKMIKIELAKDIVYPVGFILMGVMLTLMVSAIREYSQVRKNTALSKK